MPGHLLDQPRHRLQRELEALLVDEAADQQDQLLLGRGELGAQPGQLGRVLRLQVVGVDPVGDHRDPLLLDAEDVGDLLAHVVGAGDHPVGAVGDPALDPVDVGLRMLVDPALVAAVLGGVDRRHQRRVEALGEVVAGVGDEPVVAVDEVEAVAVAELDPGGEHVGVHPLDPGDELAEVGRALRLADAVDEDAAATLLGRRLLAAAGQHVDLDPALDQRLGELAHVAGEAALDQRRVLPGEDQDAGHRLARAPAGGARLRSGARARMRGSAMAGESMASSSGLGVGGGALEGVVAGLAALVEEGPVARLDGEQLARGALGAVAAQAAAESARSRRSSSRRAPQARSATAGESQVLRSLSSPQVEACERPLDRLVLGQRLGHGEQPHPGRLGARRAPRAARSRPSDHQWPSSSVSIAKTSRPRRPRRRAYSRRRAAAAARNSPAWRRAARRRRRRVVGAAADLPDPHAAQRLAGELGVGGVGGVAVERPEPLDRLPVDRQRHRAGLGGDRRQRVERLLGGALWSTQNQLTPCSARRHSSPGA